MGVYIVSWALTRKIRENEDEETYEFQTLLQAVKNVFSTDEACLAIQDNFAETTEASVNWELCGLPSVLPVTDEVTQDWLPYVDPPPANTTTRPDYLKPVP
jgi:hypothetical protein